MSQITPIVKCSQACNDSYSVCISHQSGHMTAEYIA